MGGGGPQNMTRHQISLKLVQSIYSLHYIYIYLYGKVKRLGETFLKTCKHLRQCLSEYLNENYILSKYGQESIHKKPPKIVGPNTKLIVGIFFILFKA